MAYLDQKTSSLLGSQPLQPDVAIMKQLPALKSAGLVHKYLLVVWSDICVVWGEITNVHC